MDNDTESKEKKKNDPHNFNKTQKLHPNLTQVNNPSMSVFRFSLFLRDVQAPQRVLPTIQSLREGGSGDVWGHDFPHHLVLYLFCAVLKQKKPRPDKIGTRLMTPDRLKFKC